MQPKTGGYAVKQTENQVELSRKKVELRGQQGFKSTISYESIDSTIYANRSFCYTKKFTILDRCDMQIFNGMAVALLHCSC
jgi:hypothetical protein